VKDQVSDKDDEPKSWDELTVTGAVAMAAARVSLSGRQVEDWVDPDDPHEKGQGL
jgi:hypothetical protein